MLWTCFQQDFIIMSRLGYVRLSVVKDIRNDYLILTAYLG